jgi:hypothetical protein
MWEASSTSVLNSCALEWQGDRESSRLLSDSGNSMRPAHISSKPGKDSQAAMWSTLSATYLNEVLFLVTLRSGGIIDVHVNYVLANGQSVTYPNVEYLIRTTAAVGVIGNVLATLDNSSVAGAAGTQILDPPVAGFIQTLNN